MKIKKINDFFKVDEDIEEAIQDEVTIAFGKWLCMNYTPIYQDTWDDDTGNRYTTQQLFNKFNEHRRPTS